MMQRKNLVTILATAILAMLTTAALAHPGHLHTDAPVHGLSWTDLLAWLALAVTVPALVAARIRSNRRGPDTRRRD